VLLKKPGNFLTAEDAEAAKIFKFLSALCVLCGEMKPAIASNTQEL